MNKLSKKSIEKFEKYYNGCHDVDLALFIQRHWGRYKEWSRQRYKKGVQ